MTYFVVFVALYAVAAVGLSALRRAIQRREAVDMFFASQIRAQYEFHRRFKYKPVSQP